MNLNWKVVIGAFSGALVLLTGGCSGINSSHSVSPATFLLPGLMHNEPRPADPTAPLPEPVTPVEVAQVH